VGLFLSAFFSGSETGFFRVARVRLVLDALGGDPVARGLLWLTNHPSLFVATALVGNNLATHLTSLAIVMGTQAMTGGGSHAAELIAPLVLAPVLFVYGDLVPKTLFLQAPNRLLRAGGPLFLFFVVLFFPVSVMLWGLNKILAWVVAESPERVSLTLARRELGRVLEEGREAGILHPAQQGLARGIFTLARQGVTHYATPLRDLPRARADMTRDDILRLAKRYRVSAIAVEDPDTSCLVGYVRVIELGLRGPGRIGTPRPLLEIPSTATHIDALTRMQNAEESFAQVVDAQGHTVGILTTGSLREPLFRGK
jgi:CBS domain containing-hemolysin-like protein